VWRIEGDARRHAQSGGAGDSRAGALADSPTQARATRVGVCANQRLYVRSFAFKCMQTYACMQYWITL
jgi:hypothetical protein